MKEQKLQLAAGNGLYLHPISFQNLKSAANKNEIYEYIRESTDSAFEDGYLKPNEVASEKKKWKGKGETCDDTVFKDGPFGTADGACCSRDGLLSCRDSCLEHQYQRISNIYSNPQEMSAVQNEGEKLEERYVVPKK